MSRRFNEDQTVHFVKIYRELEPLWKVSHPHYKKRSMRIACVEKIIEEMNLSDFCIRDVMVKIKSLRSTYCQEINKIHKSLTEEESGHIYQSGLKWFPDMDYIMKNCGNLRAKGPLINLQFPENDLFYLQEEVVATPIKMEVFEQQDLNITESLRPEENGIEKQEKLYRLCRSKNNFIRTDCKNRHRQSHTLSQRFNEEQTMRFVKLYRELEPLWNVSHPHYKKRSFRIACLEKIVEEINLPDFCTRDAMIKIKNLRSTYCQELNKIQRSLIEDKPGGIYQPMLKWFPDMDYVMTNCGNMRAKALMKMDFPDFYLQEEVVETPSEIEICDQTEILEPTEPQEIDTMNEIYKEQSDQTSTGETAKSKVNVIVKENKLDSRGPRRRFPKKITKTNSFNNQCHNGVPNKFGEAIRELANLSRTLRTHALQNQKVEDECDIVGRHVALQLRELPPASRLQAQLEIQKVLCNCRLSILETNKTSASSNDR